MRKVHDRRKDTERTGVVVDDIDMVTVCNDDSIDLNKKKSKIAPVMKKSLNANAIPNSALLRGLIFHQQPRYNVFHCAALLSRDFKTPRDVMSTENLTEEN